jgi:glycine/D-amino acid oxidase-like deaminating enzyme
MMDNDLKVGRRDTGRPVLLVGAGAVNLLTALALIDEGRAVLLVDSAPDPRTNRPWQQFGCTRGGRNARMFTVTEADQYSGLVPAGKPDGTVFDTPPDRGGWDVRKDVSPGHDHEWIREHTDLPPDLAAQYRTEIHSLNRAAERGWKRVFDAHPQLADSTGLRRDILRVYSTPQAVARAVHRHRGVGDLLATHSRAEIADRAPALAHARADRLSGGISVRGFTLDAHRFVALVLDILEKDGAQLRFDTTVSAVCVGPDGVVEGVRVGSEQVAVNDVVVSPGVYGNRLLADLGIGGRIAGVLGLWHVLPNLWGQEFSMKVSRPGQVAEDANITVGTDENGPALIVGAGYGFTGTDPRNIDRAQVDVIAQSVDEMMRDLLPDAYEAAGGPRWLSREPRFCVRPWTSTSLGLFDVRATRAGRCIVTGGHNTGGFAQAPAVADAVLASLRGLRHPMHDSYQSATAIDARAAAPIPTRSSA